MTQIREEDKIVRDVFALCSLAIFSVYFVILIFYELKCYPFP